MLENEIAMATLLDDTRCQLRKHSIKHATASEASRNGYGPGIGNDLAEYAGIVSTV